MPKTVAEIQSMTDTEFEKYANSIKGIDMPVHFDSADTQKFIYAMGLNGKPEVVDQTTFSKMSGTTMYRTVNEFYDKSTDVYMSAPQIHNQLMKSAYNRIGAGTYGDGFYFADNFRGSASYGNTKGNVQKTAIISMKLNKNAKVIDYSTLNRMLSKESASVRNAIGGLKDMYDQRKGGDGAISIYALRKGYNVIHNGSSYYNVIDRSAMTILNQVKPI